VGIRVTLLPTALKRTKKKKNKRLRKKIVTWEDEQYDEDAAEMGMCVTYEVYESVRSPP
jgi:hypothetical protein